ncbi:DUF4386 domain-containing protein [Demequina aurantiaca]|uniref:DUF4386 domain-containing protein n=1 Tax=Demequina aurantiaca TaxID=676200 RepID=UPI0007848F55|nr:DUF4386 domain-containing protein [Demequina aurantiaca]
MPNLTRTARITGLLYLGLALTGMLDFLIIRGELFVPDDASTTLANLVSDPTLARLGIAAELGVVLTQSLAAVWFYKLLRAANPIAAGATTAFGLVNAAAILGSTAFLASALAVAGDPSLAPGGDTAATVQLMYTISGYFWGAGAIFFGLWLIPMGYAVKQSGLMPAALGWVLMVGGIGYIASGFSAALLPDLTALNNALTIPASIGEFWMIGYLILVGVRASAVSPSASAAPMAKVVS